MGTTANDKTMYWGLTLLYGGRTVRVTSGRAGSAQGAAEASVLEVLVDGEPVELVAKDGPAALEKIRQMIDAGQF